MSGIAEAKVPEPFELSGGELCLDFANTWGHKADPKSDRMTRFDHLVAFVHQTGGVTDATAASLLRAAQAGGSAAEATLALARSLRESIYRAFASVAAGGKIPGESLLRINDMLGEALSHRRLSAQDDGVAWSWAEQHGDDPRALLWPVVVSAANLLTSDQLNRVRECDADDCNWLFLDCSRCRTRRWCSMSSCGNRAKARRHYRKQKKD